MFDDELMLYDINNNMGCKNLTPISYPQSTVFKKKFNARETTRIPP